MTVNYSIADEQTTAADTQTTAATSEWLTATPAFKKAFHAYEIASDAFGKASQADMERTDLAQYQALENAYGVAYVALMKVINGVTDTPAEQEAFSNSRAFQDALEGYDNAIENFSEASMAGLETSDRAQFEVLNKACSAAYRNLCRVIDAHRETYAPTPRKKKKRSRPPLSMCYVGIAQHIFLANKEALQNAFQDACENRASQVTFTIDLPTFAASRKQIAVHLTAPLPVYSRFVVVTIDDYPGYLHRVKETATWEEALVAAQEHEPQVKRCSRLQIIGLYEDGLRDDVELMTYLDWPRCAKRETPPTVSTQGA